MTSEDYLRFLFNQWSNGQVERVKKAKDYAFVHFYNRAAAEDAKRAVENQVSLVDTFSQKKPLSKPDITLFVMSFRSSTVKRSRWSGLDPLTRYNTTPGKL